MVQFDGNVILIDESVDNNIDLRIKVDGKKFDTRKQTITTGKHKIVITNKIALLGLSAVFWVILDFFLTLLGGVKFGELFQEQGSVVYKLSYDGEVDGNITLTYLNNELLASGINCEYEKKHLPKVENFLKHYNRNCAIILMLVALVVTAIAVTCVVVLK